MPQREAEPAAAPDSTLGRHASRHRLRLSCPVPPPLSGVLPVSGHSLCRLAHRMPKRAKAQPPFLIRPVLPWRARISLLAVSLLLPLGIWVMIVAPDERVMGGILIALPLWAVYGWTRMPREVIFDQAIVIRPRWGRETKIEYRDITAFGIGRLISKTGRLGWWHFANAYEFDRAARWALRSARIRPRQLSRGALQTDLSAVSAMMWTKLIGAALGLGSGLFVTSRHFEWPWWFNSFFVFCLVFVLIRIWSYRAV